MGGIISESQPYGGDDAYSAKITTDTNPASAIIHAAGKLTQDFGMYKKQMVEKERRWKEEEARRQKMLADREQRAKDREAAANADKDKKDAARTEKKLKRAAEARALRKQIRAESEKEKQDAADKERQDHQNKLAAGHIMEANYKFKYREFLLSLNAEAIIELNNESKIDPTVLPKMFKYGKSIETNFQRFSGALVTAVRQRRFKAHSGMNELLAAKQKKESGTSKTSDGPYRLLHPLFSPNGNVTNNPIITNLKHSAKHIIASNSASAANAHNFSGFTPESIIAYFDNIIKASGVETMVYVTIDLYNRTYEKLTTSGENMFGEKDPKRFDSEGNVIEWGDEYSKQKDREFPLYFFRTFSTIFEAYRRENMSLYNHIEDIIHQHGIKMADENDEPDYGGEEQPENTA